MVKIHLSTTDTTDWKSHMCDGWDNFKRAFSGVKEELHHRIFRTKSVTPYEEISLMGRVKVGFAGLGLMIPVLNMLVYRLLKGGEPMKGVHFYQVRVRPFNGANPPQDVGAITSFRNDL